MTLQYIFKAHNIKKIHLYTMKNYIIDEDLCLYEYIFLKKIKMAESWMDAYHGPNCVF